LDLAGRSILVVEDEPLICLDIATRLRDAGAHVLAASHLEKAMTLADRPELSAGVLDFSLGAVDSSSICWKLVERHIPFLFHTGRVYPAFQQWPTAPVLLKPSHPGLIASVAALFR
jgi:DNA-binding response OmpR family regulator